MCLFQFYRMPRKLSGLGRAGGVMGRSKREGVQMNVKKDIAKEKDGKKQVVLGHVAAFSCPHCEKAFDQKTCLTKHLKSHPQLTDQTQGIKESIVNELICKEDSGATEEKENLPDLKIPVLKHLKVMKTKKGGGSKNRLEVLRVSQVSSAMKSLISPASGGRSKVKRVLRKKSGSLHERPKSAAKKVEEETTSNDGIGSKHSTRAKVRNGSPGQSGLMYPGWHASAAGILVTSSVGNLWCHRYCTPNSFYRALNNLLCEC